MELTRLEHRAEALRKQIHLLRDRGSAAAPDPVGEFWALLTRGLLSVRDVGFGLPLGFALMIEMVLAFGPLGIVSYADATRGTTKDDMTRRVVPGRAVPRDVVTGPAKDGEEKQIGGVVQYMADRTEPTSNPAGLGAAELHADYQLWCVSKNLRTLSQGDFVDEFDDVRASPQLAGTIKKFGTRYFGIALVDSNVVKLTR